MALTTKKEDSLILELSKNNLGDHRIRTDGLDPERSYVEKRDVVKVRGETLDEVCVGLEPHDALIWMDTQGYEGYVLKGGGDTLRRGLPIVLEFWPLAMSQSNSFYLLKNSLLNGGYTKFIDLKNLNEELALTDDALNDLYEKLGKELGGGSTDIYVF